MFSFAKVKDFADFNFLGCNTAPITMNIVENIVAVLHSCESVTPANKAMI